MRQSKLQGTRKSYKLDITWLDTSTIFLSTCNIAIIWLPSADSRGHKKSITWRYAEHSDVANVTSAGYNGVNTILKASLLLNVHTMPSKHFIWCWTHLSYTYVQLISEVQMLLQGCFKVQYPSQSGEHHVIANSTHSTSNFPWLRYVFQPCLSSAAPRTLLNACAIDRLMLWKHCYHSVFSSSCFSVHRWLA